MIENLAGQDAIRSRTPATVVDIRITGETPILAGPLIRNRLHHFTSHVLLFDSLLFHPGKDAAEAGHISGKERGALPLRAVALLVGCATMTGAIQLSHQQAEVALLLRVAELCGIGYGVLARRRAGLPFQRQYHLQQDAFVGEQQSFAIHLNKDGYSAIEGKVLSGHARSCFPMHAELSRGQAGQEG